MSSNFGSQNPYATPQFGGQYSNPSNVGGQLPLATRMERFAGAFVDGLIVGPVAFVMGMALGFALVLVGLSPESVAFQVVSAVLGGILGAGIFLAINGYFLANRGQTIGKMLLKTKIVLENGEPMPFGPLVLKRYLPLWILTSIPIVGPFGAIVNALAIFRGNRKCLHDDIAGTKVVKIS